jgi:hypothetical protein
MHKVKPALLEFDVQFPNATTVIQPEWPFRCEQIFAWEDTDTSIVSIRVDNFEQLTGPLPASTLTPSFTPEIARAMFTSQSRLFNNERLRLALDTCEVGNRITIRYIGKLNALMMYGLSFTGE